MPPDTTLMALCATFQARNRAIDAMACPSDATMARLMACREAASRQALPLRSTTAIGFAAKAAVARALLLENSASPALGTLDHDLEFALATLGEAAAIAHA